MTESTTENLSTEQVSWRPPAQVMRLERLGCAHPTRLSFLRILLRRMEQDAWQFDRSVWSMDSSGVGVAVYRAIGPSHTYSLVAFAHDLPDEMRSDRVIATAWDATFTLFDGEPDASDIERLSENVPLQEAGRISSSELSLSRANRSVRLFNYVVDCLAQGRQPDAQKLLDVGYLMRTTAVYGSGKFGALDRRDMASRDHFNEPFQIEMLSVWLIRQFVVDIVNHIAKCRGGKEAIELSTLLRRSIGVGNSTGLGMAPFVVRHPVLLNNWMMVREEALSRVRSCKHVDKHIVPAMQQALHHVCETADSWQSDHPVQVRKLSQLRGDLIKITEQLKQLDYKATTPWNTLWLWGEQTLSLEGQEALLAILVEPYGELVDGLSGCLSADEEQSFRLDGAMTVQSLRSVLQENYAWALNIDFNQPENTARFWYVSEDKLEPRLGERATVNDSTLEQPLCIARYAKSLHEALQTWDDSLPVSRFVLQHPEHRLMVRRAQMGARYAYAEIRDNLIASDMLPIDLLRCKLAFFGATHFDPRSDRWVRISLFQGMPYPDEMNKHEKCERSGE